MQSWRQSGRLTPCAQWVQRPGGPGPSSLRAPTKRGVGATRRHNTDTHVCISVSGAQETTSPNSCSSSIFAEFDVGTWVVALAFLLAFRLGRLASQEAYNLPQSPATDVIGKHTIDQRTDNLQESGKKPECQDDHSRQAEIAEAVQKAKIEAEQKKQEQEAYARAAQQEAEIARLQQEKASREFLEQQARLAAEIKERQAREMEIIREQRESEALKAAELQRQEEEERSRQEAKRLEQERAAAVAKQKVAEEKKNVRRALRRCDSEVHVQARLVPLTQSNRKIFVCRGLIPVPVRCSLRISCRITNNGRLLTQAICDLPVVSEEEAGCLEYIGPEIVACVRAVALRSQDLEDKAPDSRHCTDEQADWAALISILSALRLVSAQTQDASCELRCPVVSLQGWREQERMNADNGQRDHNSAENTIAAAFPLDRIIKMLQVGVTSVADLESDFRELALAEQEILQDFSDHAIVSEPTMCGFIAAALAAGRVIAALPLHDSIDLTPLASQVVSVASTCSSDSLQVPCALLAAALGPDHPLKPILESIAETNLSTAARRNREEERHTALKSLAERLERLGTQENVDREQDEILDSLPVPDRIWILITVAKSLEEEPASLGLARRLAETALTVKENWTNISNMQHPCLLPELLVLEGILRRNPKWHRDAAGLAGLLLRTSMNLADDYVKAGDPLSALLLIEGAQRRFSKVLTPGHQAMKSAMRASQEIQHRLPAEELKLLPHLRRDVCPGILASLSSKLAEPSAYGPATNRTSHTKDSRVQEWSSKGIWMLGRLH